MRVREDLAARSFLLVAMITVINLERKLGTKAWLDFAMSNCEVLDFSTFTSFVKRSPSYGQKSQPSSSPLVKGLEVGQLFPSFNRIGQRTFGDGLTRTNACLPFPEDATSPVQRSTDLPIMRFTHVYGNIHPSTSAA
jgi:hypothetical protein